MGQLDNYRLWVILQYINDLPDDGIRDIPIYDDDSTLYCKFDQASDL